MVELFREDEVMNEYRSSKGNQLKWKSGEYWYKADQNGYEGMSEYLVSNLLLRSNLDQEMITTYETEEIRYRKKIYRGCKSRNFLRDGESLITLERLYWHAKGNRSLYKCIFSIPEETDRIRFLVNEIQQITGLRKFGEYLCLLLEIDALFLNEDRHMHNIAVILQSDGTYRLAPVFDNGACLLFDTEMDYPMTEDPIELIRTVKSKTIATSFQSQLDAIESLYPQQIQFYFTHQDVEQILRNEPYYPQEIKDRVRDVVFQQKSRYSYLF